LVADVRLVVMLAKRKAADPAKPDRAGRLRLVSLVSGSVKQELSRN